MDPGDPKQYKPLVKSHSFSMSVHDCPLDFLLSEKLFEIKKLYVLNNYLILNILHLGIGSLVSKYWVDVHLKMKY